jgi:hypothetical protein
MSDKEKRLETLKLQLSKTVLNAEHQQWRENRINSYRNKAVSVPIQPPNTTTTQTVTKTSIILDDDDDILASITSARQQLVTSLSNPPPPPHKVSQKESNDDDEFSTYSDEPKLDTQQKQQPHQRQHQHQPQVQTQATTTTASSSSLKGTDTSLPSNDVWELPLPKTSYGTSQQQQQQQPSIQQIKSTSAKPATAAYGLFGANKDEALDDIY